MTMMHRRFNRSSCPTRCGTVLCRFMFNVNTPTVPSFLETVGAVLIINN